MEQKKYPIGIQSFQKIIEGNYIYVDKTRYVHEICNNFNYVFLSRPRRFGKSLLSSTLKSYFEGKKELFKGLAIESLENDWIKHPVLYFDFSTMKYLSIDKAKTDLDVQLSRFEEIYGTTENAADSFGIRLKYLILRAVEQTGHKAVVIIDEYDCPLLEVLHMPDTLIEFRQFFREFYSPLKGCDQSLRFVFLTGVTKFSQLSIFSEFNNLKDISMMPDYSGICGITKTELNSQLMPYIEKMAVSMNVTTEKMCDKLRQHYDGYHFSRISDDIYNPFSLFNALNDKFLSNYWFVTGTSSYLVNLLKTYPLDVEKLDHSTASTAAFDTPTATVVDALPVLYQGGYLTIKSYDSITDRYVLGFPNNEVRIGFFDAMLPYYVGKHFDVKNEIGDLYMALLSNDMDLMLQRIKTFFDGIPNTLENKTEKHYQTIFYIIMKLMGMYIDVEVNSAIGRADAILKTKTHIYAIEMKMEGSAHDAIQQINEKGYLRQFAHDGRKLVKVGINFDNDNRTLGDWIIEEGA